MKKYFSKRFFVDATRKQQRAIHRASTSNTQKLKNSKRAQELIMQTHHSSGAETIDRTTSLTDR